MTLVKNLVFTDITLNSKRLFSGLDRRYFVFLTAIKIIMSISLTFFGHYPIVFQIVFPLSAVILLSTLFVNVPFFKLKSNTLAAFGSGIFFAFACTNAVFQMFSINLHLWVSTFLIYLVPLFIGFLCHFLMKKWYYMVISKFISNAEAHVSSLSNSDNSYSSQEKEADFEEFLAATIVSPKKVEKLIRALITVKNPSNQIVNACRLVIDISLKKFPDSLQCILVQCMYQLFLGKDYIRLISTVDRVKDLDMDVSFQEQYFFDSVKILVEKRRRIDATGDESDSTSFIVVQKLVNEAVEKHNETLEYLSTFWRLLLAYKSHNGTCSKLPLVAEKIFQSKTVAERKFTRLFDSYPHDLAVLYAYRNFAREVLNDDEFTEFLTSQIELSSSDGPSSGDHSSVELSVSGSRKSLALKKKLKRKPALSMSFLLSTSSSQGTRYSKAVGLKRSVNVAMLLLLLIACSSFFLSFRGSISSNHWVSLYSETVHIGKSLSSTITNSFLLSQPNLPESIVTISESIMTESVHALFHLSRLLMGSFSTSESHEYLFDCQVSDFPRVLSPSLLNRLTGTHVSRVSQTHSYPFLFQSNVVSLFELSQELSWRAVANLNDLNEKTTDSSVDHLKFLTANFDVFIGNFFNFLNSVVEYTTGNVYSSVLVLAIHMILAFLTLFVLGFLFFRRSLNEITKSKNEIFNLFLHFSIPSLNEILSSEKFASRSQAFGKGNTDSLTFESSLEKASTLSISDDESTSIKLQLVPEVEKFTGENEKRESTGKLYLIIPLLLLVFTGLLVYGVFEFQTLSLDTQFIVDHSNEVATIAHDLDSLLFNSVQSSKNVLAFVTTGNLKYYHRYVEILNSAVNFECAERLRTIQLEPTTADLLGRFQYYQAFIEHKNAIAFKLAQLGYNYSDYDMPEFSSIDYDFTRFPNWKVDSFEYQDVLWYTSLQNDELLSSLDQLQVAKEIVSNRRHLELDWKRLETVLSFVETLFGSFKMDSDRIITEVKTRLTFFSCSAVFLILCFIMLLFYFVFRLSFSSLRKTSIFLISTIVLFLTFSIIFCLLSLNNFQVLATDFSAIVEVQFSHFMADVSEDIAEYFVQYFVLFENIFVFNEIELRRRSICEVVATVALLVDNTSISNDLKTTFTTFSQKLLEFSFEPSRFIEDVAMSLISRSLNVPSALFSKNITWNFEGQTNYWSLKTQFGHFNFDYFYSNSDRDLSLSSSDQKSLAQSIILSDIYYHVLGEDNVYIDSLNDFFFDTTNELLGASLHRWLSSFNPVFYFLLFCIAFSSISIFVVFLGMSPLKNTSNHVVENFEFQQLKSLNRTYIIALIVLFVFLCYFLMCSTMGTLGNISLYNSIAKSGERIVHFTNLLFKTLLMVQEDTPLQRILIDKAGTQLRICHSKLTFGDVNNQAVILLSSMQGSTHFPQNFHSNFSLSSLGLHNSLEHFIQLSHVIAHGLSVPTITNSDYTHLLEQKDLVAKELSFAFEQLVEFARYIIQRSRRMCAFSFSLVLLTILIEFFVVFNPMISHLEDEEQTVFLLLSAIPKKTVDSVVEIKEFLETFDLN
ncbi:hypothetical protein RCL1_001281 [Eukaryota sp. TZLM3-RCL]